MLRNDTIAAQDVGVCRNVADAALSRRFPEISDQQWRAFVAEMAEALELRERDRVFEVQCGTAELLLPLYEAGCVVGGNDPDSQLVDVARRNMPRGQWHVGGIETLAASAPWDVVIACSAVDASSTVGDATLLVERMAQNAAAAIAILDVPAGIAVDERWFLRLLMTLGATSVRLPALQIPGHDFADSRFNVIARLR
jgi:trans-aconitate methyltransferase